MASKIVEELTFRDRLFVFQDKVEAGRLLTEKLRDCAGKKQIVFLLFQTTSYSVYSYQGGYYGNAYGYGPCMGRR